MYTFHRAVYAVLSVIVRAWFRISGKYSYTRYEPVSKTSLILTNHNTNWDFLYFGAAFRGHMYFVASEHIFRTGLISKLIVFLAGPIARKKGASSVETVREIRRRLAKGCNVCMMADGNRSFGGQTGFISPATAKLARSCGAGLVTYRIHGGYFVNPRWSRKTRKGPVWGELAGQYTHEELKAMTNEEVYQLICRDLAVDAYEDQKEKNYSYKSKALAEDLETALFACPDCGSFASLKSREDRLTCEKCGSTHVFTEKGYFIRPDGSRPAFSTITEWSEWQKSALKNHIALLTGGKADDIIRTDENASIYLVHPKEGKVLKGEGRITLFRDRLQVADLSFPVETIISMAVILINTILFTAGDDYYELRLGEKTSALHYLISYYYLSGKEYIN